MVNLSCNEDEDSYGMNATFRVHEKGYLIYTWSTSLHIGID